MSRANTDKAFWHNFDVLNSKMLVTKLDFEYQRLNLFKTKRQPVEQFQRKRRTCNDTTVFLFSRE